ncbi:MAG TPA: biotin--[acetyl-CoA-carboxylase] ligase, partial [Novosphingobium sp.]
MPDRAAGPVEVLAEIGSTNAELIARLARGEPAVEGRWLVADRQTEGRGRQGRAWFDGQGNFMGSTAVHARAGDPSLPSLALVAGLALYEVVAPHLPPPLRPVLKWPNDIMIGGGKLAGILL